MNASNEQLQEQIDELEEELSTLKQKYRDSMHVMMQGNYNVANLAEETGEIFKLITSLITHDFEHQRRFLVGITRAFNMKKYFGITGIAFYHLEGSEAKPIASSWEKPPLVIIDSEGRLENSGDSDLHLFPIHYKKDPLGCMLVQKDSSNLKRFRLDVLETLAALAGCVLAHNWLKE